MVSSALASPDKVYSHISLSRERKTSPGGTGSAHGKVKAEDVEIRLGNRAQFRAPSSLYASRTNHGAGNSTVIRCAKELIASQKSKSFFCGTTTHERIGFRWLTKVSQRSSG